MPFIYLNRLAVLLSAPPFPPQDTVVALQALAKYGAATYSSEGASVVAVTSLEGVNWQFTVNQSTRLLYQEQPLDQVPGEYKITAQGQSCVQAQVRLHNPIKTHHTTKKVVCTLCKVSIKLHHSSSACKEKICTHYSG